MFWRSISNWSISPDNILTVNVTVPPNTTAALVLPTADAKTITEGGQPLTKVQGIERTAAQPGQLMIDLRPGVYQFQSRLDARRQL